MAEQKVVLVTGASSGIGAATARLLAADGHRVLLVARRIERLEALAEEIRSAGGSADPIQADIGTRAAIDDLTEACLSLTGRVDVLLNNAGFGRLDWLEQLDPGSGIDLQFQVNVLGTVHLTQALLPHMIERRSGHIINMASLAGFVATPTYSVYAASKFALRGFGDALRREVGVWGIKVTTIYPGGVATEFKAHTGAKRKTNVSTPQALLLTPQQVGKAVVKSIRRPRRTVVLPALMWFSIWTNALFPGLVDRTVERQFVKPERGL